MHALDAQFEEEKEENTNAIAMKRSSNDLSNAKRALHTHVNKRAQIMCIRYIKITHKLNSSTNTNTIYKCNQNS